MLSLQDTILQTYPSFFQIWNVVVKSIVHLCHIQHRCQFNAVEELTCTDTYTVFPKIPIKEHSGGNDPLIIHMAFIAVVEPIKLA